MGAQAIDLSAGLVPATPTQAPTSSGIDLSAGLVPSSNQDSAPSFQNDNGEGTYQMQTGDGVSRQVPYSQVELAKKNGYQLAGADAGRYDKDFRNDPETRRVAAESAGDSLDPTQRIGLGALKSAVGGVNTMVGGVDWAANKIDDAVGAKREKPWKAALESGEERLLPGVSGGPSGPLEHIGAAAEQVGEWIWGEGEWRKMTEGLDLAQKVKLAQPAMKFIAEHPTVARHIGAGAGGAVQALAHGATPTQAATTGVAGGLGGALLEKGMGAASEALSQVAPEVKNIAGVDVNVPAAVRNAVPTEAQAQGAEIAGNVAKEAARPHLEALRDAAPRPYIEMNEAGEPTGNMVQPKVAAVDPDEALKNVKNFHGAADALTEQAAPIYQQADELSGGKVREASNALKQAQKDLWDARSSEGNPVEAEKAVDKASQAFDAALDGVKDKLPVQQYQAAKAAFRQSFQLRKVGDVVDNAVTGDKGGFFSGGKFVSGWKRLNNRIGEDQLRQTLGNERYEAMNQLSQIHDAPINGIARYLKSKGMEHSLIPGIAASTGAGVGGAVAHAVGLPWELGSVAGAGMGHTAMRGTKAVVNALLTNPKAMNNLIFAVDSGARASNYLPLITNMLVQHNDAEGGKQ
jgi:hypothetical protein